ncbi:type II secretion system F family protein [Priestia aryabhattai]|uniref:Type II secretion system F family protein n=1 Tax=Priestia aryabhattai TaxID=412384 RepID=A0AAX6NDC2_PRIAR|nr:type II secretion system F family protein [Priestia aryabhattai]MDU9693736.1 type II secretion system F family protein [Priestia aryabhattai]
MFIFTKIADLYSNDLVTMLQINALTLLFAIILYEFWIGRKNPLSKQVLDRMKKSKNKTKRFNYNDILDEWRSRLVKVEKKAELRLARANLDFSPKEYVTFYIFGVLAGVIIGFVFFPFAGVFKSVFFFLGDNIFKTLVARIASGAAFALIGTFTPHVWTYHLINKRKKALEEQLLEFLMSLADGVKSSPTVQEALSIVAKEIQEPLSSELTKTVQELQYAKPFEQALEALAERIGVKEYTLAINAMQIQDRTGGELEKLLRNMAKVFQERQELMAEVKKIVRGPKTTSYILLAAPFVFAILFSTFSKGFFSALFTSTVGWGCVIGAIVLYVIAFFLIIKINKYIDKVV